MKQIDFYFDFLSPYSFLAWNWLKSEKDYLKTVGQLNFRPTQLAKVIHFHGTLGPAEIAPKREFLMKDCLRYCQLNNIEFRPPPLPFNPLYALRISLHEVSGVHQFEVIDHFYRLAWQKGKDLGDDEFITESLKELSQQLKVDTSSWMERVGEREVRSALKKNTKLANELGLFGLPSFLVYDDETNQSELFWGNDSTKYLKMYLEGRDPLDIENLEYFKSCYQSFKKEDYAN